MCDVNPCYPKLGYVRWREIILDVTSSQNLETFDLEKTGVLLGHGSHPLSITSIAQIGRISISFDSSRHEFGGSTGVYVSKLTDPKTL